jgi:hypothetical protein
VASGSTLMGIAVFGTYDGILHGWQHQHQHQHGSTEKEMASVALHTTAGAAAGVARSVFWMIWEGAVHQHFRQPRFFIRTTLHHSVGYGALFGSYQAFRHSLAGIFDQTSPSSVNDSHHHHHRLINISLAGGFAGQVHHVVSHYTSHAKVFYPSLPPPPRLRPTVLSFGPMALGFLAFEYGAETMDELQQQGENVLESYNKKFRSDNV